MPNASRTYRRPKPSYEHKQPLSREDFAAHLGMKVVAIATENNWSLEARTVAIAFVKHLVHDEAKPEAPNRDFSANQVNLVHDAFFDTSMELGPAAKRLRLEAAQSPWFRSRFKRYMENKKASQAA